MRRSTVKELHRSGEQITRRSRVSYAFTTLLEWTPFEGVPRLYDQRGVLRIPFFLACLAPYR
jgi:hypothetical protein